MRIAIRAAAAAAVLLAATVGGARAGVVIDQSNTATVQEFYNTGASVNLPIGQSFTPVLSALDFVDLHIDDAGSDAGPGTNFEVRIRSGSISGTIAGTSRNLFVPDGTNTGGGSTISHFTFDAPVSLTAGSLYVIEVVQLGPLVPGNSNFGVDGNFGNTYARGQAVIGGQPQTNFDFYFVEGVAVPEPTSVTLMGVGAVVLMGAVGRKRRAV